MGDYSVRFPIPVLFFGNLANIWKEISKDTSEIDREQFLHWINAHVYISGYKMKTVQVKIGKPKPVVGGLGNATFRVVKIDKNYYVHLMEEIGRQHDYEYVNEDYSNNCRWLEILCKVGELTNVGANRTAGMGVMRYYPRSYLLKSDLLMDRN
jgi:CRISPR/Cas system endoribonuclease Cas6 (RAMP superfamily)